MREMERRSESERWGEGGEIQMMIRLKGTDGMVVHFCETVMEFLTDRIQQCFAASREYSETVDGIV